MGRVAAAAAAAASVVVAVDVVSFGKEQSPRASS